MTATVAEVRHARVLVSSELFDRMVTRIAKDEGVERAERIMDQSLAFLAASAQHTGQSLVPSEPVDVGWHTFILYTREYAAFCDEVAGRFIHHVPNDLTGKPERSEPSEARRRTLAAIANAGYAVDPELWPAWAENCGTCQEEGNCSSSGKDGNENTETRKK